MKQQPDEPDFKATLARLKAKKEAIKSGVRNPRPPASAPISFTRKKKKRVA